jgi:hypothetical protein
LERLRNRVVSRPVGSAQEHMRSRHFARRWFAFLDQIEQILLLSFG